MLDGGGSNRRQPALAASAATHTTRMPAKCLGTRSVASPLARSVLRTEAAEKVHDVPHVLVRQLALERDHFRVGAPAVLDEVENFAVRGAVVPFRVGQIRRLGVFRRERTIALARGSVA